MVRSYTVTNAVESKGQTEAIWGDKYRQDLYAPTCALVGHKYQMERLQETG